MTCAPSGRLPRRRRRGAGGHHAKDRSEVVVTRLQPWGRQQALELSQPGHGRSVRAVRAG